jgi:hypothetical protein
MHQDLNLRYEIADIRFAEAPNYDCMAIANGTLTFRGRTRDFSVHLAPADDGTWYRIGGRLQYEHLFLREDPEFWAPIVRTAGVLLKTINMWTVSSEANGAQVALNEQLAPAEHRDRVHFSIRPNMFDLPDADWPTLWGRIESRVKVDPFFEVRGYTRQEILTALRPLKKIFQIDWVKRRYRDASQEKRAIKLAANAGREMPDWFPAAHLARTALGAICVDPAWNYLVNIGQAVHQLTGFPGADRLFKELTRNPGSQHNLCMAAELLQRGLLVGLEAPTGVGNATNDLLVKVGEVKYAIEVKEFHAADPIAKLKKELSDKAKKLPAIPREPVIFHVVLAETDGTRVREEDNFVESVSQVAVDLPLSISAIVVGRRFIDAAGGPVKRDTRGIFINPSASNPSVDADLLTIFEKNFAEITYPQFGVSSFMDWQTQAPT